MPSTATITAYYTFTANTKARASQVNTNFNNYRGHNLPIDPNTIAGADNTYDHGSAEYQWRTGYFGTSIILSGLTTTGHTTFKDNGATTGGLDILIGGTVASRLVAPTQTTQTLTASYGQWAIGNTILGATSGASPQDVYTGITQSGVRHSTLTVASTGRPIEYGFIFDIPGVADADTSGAWGYANGMIHFQNQPGSGNGPLLYMIANGVTLTGIAPMISAGLTGGSGTFISYPASSIKFIDYTPTPTTAAKYELGVNVLSTADSISFFGIRPYVREL